MRRVDSLVFLLTFLGLSLAGGCDRGPRDASSTPAAKPAPPATQLPAGLFLDAEPPGAMNVADVKRDPPVTGEVVLRGRIGGQKEPIVAGRAVFMIADMRLPVCGVGKQACCDTPWDYCCESPETKLANTATIQVVDADGHPLKVELGKVHGLAPQKEVVVRGTIARRDDAGVLIVTASGIWIKP